MSRKQTIASAMIGVSFIPVCVAIVVRHSNNVFNYKLSIRRCDIDNEVDR